MEELFLRNPWIRAILPLALSAASSVFSSSLVVEIANGNEINWSHVPEKPSFYILIICALTLCSYQALLSRHDNNLFTGLSPEQWEATMRNKLAEDTAKRARKLIKDGNIKRLEEETETFKKLFGEKR